MSSSRAELHALAALMCVSILASTAYAATRDDELLVDPTTPLRLTATPTAPAEDGSLLGFLNGLANYELSSVLVRAGDRVAVINGQRVRVGDRIGTARVTAIEADHVNLNIDGKNERLELYRGSIKTLSKVASDDE